MQLIRKRPEQLGGCSGGAGGGYQLALAGLAPEHSESECGGFQAATLHKRLHAASPSRNAIGAVSRPGFSGGKSFPPVSGHGGFENKTAAPVSGNTASPKGTKKEARPFHRSSLMVWMRGDSGIGARWRQRISPFRSVPRRAMVTGGLAPVPLSSVSAVRSHRPDKSGAEIGPGCFQPGEARRRVLGRERGGLGGGGLLSGSGFQDFEVRRVAVLLGVLQLLRHWFSVSSGMPESTQWSVRRKVST